MKNQALFSLKDKSKKLKCRLLQFLFGALRINPSLFCAKKKCSDINSLKLLLKFYKNNSYLISRFSYYLNKQIISRDFLPQLDNSELGIHP